MPLIGDVMKGQTQWLKSFLDVHYSFLRLTDPLPSHLRSRYNKGGGYVTVVCANMPVQYLGFMEYQTTLKCMNEGKARTGLKVLGDYTS